METEIKTRPMTDSIEEVFNIAGIDICIPKFRKKDYSLTYIALVAMQKALAKELKGVLRIEVEDDMKKDRFGIVIHSQTGVIRSEHKREDQMYI